MNEPTPTEPTGEVVGWAMARRLGVGLLAAYLLIVLLSFIDGGRRAKLETTRELPLTRAVTK